MSRLKRTWIGLVTFGLIVFAGAGMALALDCEDLEGSNAGAQNYARWASTVNSYLFDTGSGIERVEYIGNKLVWEQYDSTFALQDFKTVDLSNELPIFGGVHRAGNFYYLVTGQQNLSESNTTDVVRISKFNSDFSSRIGTVSLKGANTYIPFDAGSLRMTDNGTFLVIRTSHEMYKSDDGYHHQSSMSILVNMDSMTIVDSHSAVAYVGAGYVSHSFNQFVALDGDQIVAADHGDAYPRGIVIMKYNKSLSNSPLSGGCKNQTIFSFQGSIGNNTTGASLGGLLVTPSTYLLVFNSVEQDSSFESNKTRNVYVASINKNLDKSSIKVTKITEYEEGEATSTTPQLTKIYDNSYMVLWGRNDGKVYYTYVDAAGNKAGSTYEQDGKLSDCAPIVKDGTVYWYASDDGDIDLMAVDNENPETVKTNHIENGHDYELQSVDAGVATVKCSKCGGTKQYIVPTALTAYWREGNSGSYRTSWENKILKTGTDEGYYIQPTISSSSTLPSWTRLKIVSSDPDVVWVEKEINKEKTGTLLLKKAGIATVTISPEYNPAAAVKQTFIVFDPLSIDGFVVVDGEGNAATSFPFGASPNLQTTTSNGYKGLSYAYKITEDGGAVTNLTSSNTNALSDPPGANVITAKDKKEWEKPKVGIYSLEVTVTNKYGSGTGQSDVLTKTIEKVEIVKAPAPSLDAVTREYVYGFEDAGELDVSALLPDDRGNTAYSVDVKDQSGILAKAAVSTAGVLTYNVIKDTTVGLEATITVTAVFENYEDAIQTVTVRIRDKYPLKAKEGNEPFIEGTLSYGEKLSGLVFDQTKIGFVTEEGTDMPGSIAWDDPDMLPTPGKDVPIAWSFIPENPKYQTVTGTLPVTISKASLKDLPKLSEEYVYSPAKTLAVIQKGYQSGLKAKSTVTGEDVPGVVEFKEPSVVPGTKTTSCEAEFIPDREDLFERTDISIGFSISRAQISFSGEGKASAITFHDTLSSSVISGIQALCDGVEVEGKFAFKEPDKAPGVRDGEAVNAVLYDVVFTPTDQDNYIPGTEVNPVAQLPVPVNKAIAMLATDHFDYKKVVGGRTWDTDFMKGLPEDRGSHDKYSAQWSIDVIDTVSLSEQGVATVTTAKEAAVGQTGTVNITVETDNYQDISLKINVEITDKYTVVPVSENGPAADGNLFYGQKVGILGFANGTISFVNEDDPNDAVAGSIEWTDPDNVPTVGTGFAGWKFTPYNSEYDTATGTTPVTVKKAPLQGMETAGLSYTYNAAIVYDPLRTLSEIDPGQVLAKSSISRETVPGHISWANTAAVPEVNVTSYPGIFVPDGTAAGLYEETAATVAVTVKKATPALQGSAAATSIVYGQSLGEAALSGISAFIAGHGVNTTVSGKLVWNDTEDALTSRIIPPAGDEQHYPVCFVPDDQDNYLSVSATGGGDPLMAVIHVEKSPVPANAPKDSVSVSHALKTVGEIALPDGWVWDEGDKEKALNMGETLQATVKYVAADAPNYITVSKSVNVTSDGHSWNNGEVIREATTTQTGIRRYSCTACTATYDEEIPMLPETKATQPSSEVPMQVPAGVSMAVAETRILALRSEKDAADTSFGQLCAQAASSTKKSNKLKWQAMPGASGYTIYGNQCGNKYAYEKLAELTGGGIRTWTHQNLKKGTYYKYIIVAWTYSGSEKMAVSVSKTIHVATKGGAYGNCRKVSLNKKNVSLKKGKKFKIKAEEIISGKAKRHRRLMFESSDPNVASVNAKGVVKAKAAGTCTIFAYSQNGIFAKLKVKVAK